MERCACCNARLNGQTVCPRCQANLAYVADTGQRAQLLLENAMQLWFAGESKLAILALTQASGIQRTPAFLLFRDFVIRQSCPKVLTLLSQYHYKEAQQWLTLLRTLHPNHSFLLQLQGFCQHLNSQPYLS